VFYYQKIMTMLVSWIVQINLSEKERTDVLNEWRIGYLLEILANTDHNLSVAYTKLTDWEKAQYYCEQAVIHAKQLNEGENKFERVYNYLYHLGDTYHTMDKLTEAKATIEEAYMLVSEVYDPEHPLVLEAGGKLVEILTSKGKYYDAERFARVVYESTTPMDPDALARAACNLSRLIFRNVSESADIEEAEMLARKSVQIMIDFKGPAHEDMILCFKNLVDVLKYQKKRTETYSLLENCQRDAIRYQGRDNKSTGHAYQQLGNFHKEIATMTITDDDDAIVKHCEISESYYKKHCRYL
jgi:tetratricopeptide (TPR) repeat protein